MAHAAYLREKAIQLRKERELTIDELAERLALSRSTIYYWVRDIPITRKPSDGFPASARQKARKALIQKYGLIREAEYERGIEEYPAFMRVPTFRDFVSLYIAEGYKRDRNSVALGNSDPAVVRLANNWISHLAARPPGYRVHHHADQDPARLAAFWANELAIPAESIRFQAKSNSARLSKRVWRCEHGVIAVRANDTYLRARLQAWMDCLRDEWLDSP
jgi:transcriptional regulator with XRE-family HTH domain